MAFSSWVIVESSNLRYVRYDHENEVMEIEFVSGATYRYDEVPIDIFNDLVHAESPGTQFNDTVRGYYEYERIRG